jgi:YebC/PmpR family DNA-binding regulatory protein
MSGHSRWAQIKRQKQKGDVKKGQVFSKLANAITIATKEGGSKDPQTNFRLRLAIDAAKAFNMPKENITRAIDRGLGREALEERLEEVIYEGYGPLGIAIVAEVATDNRNRSNSEIKKILELSGGGLAGPNSVLWCFEKRGMITVKSNKGFDEVFMAAADLGAEDVEEAGNVFEVYTKPEELENVRKNLVDRGFEVVSAELTLKPKEVVTITDREKAQKVLALMDRLDDLDFVQKVYSNFDIPDEILQNMKI